MNGFDMEILGRTLSAPPKTDVQKQTEILDKRFSALEQLLLSEVAKRDDAIAQEHRFTIKCTLICGLICAIVGAITGFIFAQLPLS